MENTVSISLKNYLASEQDNSKMLEGINSLDRQLKYLHDNNYYVTSINSSDVVFSVSDDKEYFGFSKIDKIPKNCNKKQIVEENIKSLVELSLGVYVYLAMGNGNYFYDYTEISKKYPSYIKDNYLSIRSAIPYGAEYYDLVILNREYSYFSDYIKMLNDESSRKRGNAVTKVKSTPTGRALAERDDAAFVSAIFYPIVIICIVICIIMVYLLYKYL
ncbi:MAG: hypothetical protein ACI4OG_01565 [Bacilli bacterium]